MIATPFLPTEIQNELDSSKRHFDETARCLFCDILDKERAETDRMLIDSEEFIAFCPYASRFPYETWIAPQEHSEHFMSTKGSDLPKLARTLLKVVKKIENLGPTGAYNYMIHTTPFDRSEARHYHWHIEIVPRMGNIAGFEWGTGCFINPVSPERAAKELRIG
jgi:UDPglucose--hexose-1-phosphate uridylyltransferase